MSRLTDLRAALPQDSEYTTRHEPYEGSGGYTYSLYSPRRSDIEWLLDIAEAVKNFLATCDEHPIDLAVEQAFLWDAMCELMEKDERG